MNVGGRTQLGEKRGGSVRRRGVDLGDVGRDRECFCMNCSGRISIRWRVDRRLMSLDRGERVCTDIDPGELG